MHKMILTADDYGPVKNINDGIIDLVLAKKINSTNVLINYGGETVVGSNNQEITYPSSVDEVRRLCETCHPDKNNGHPLEIGCHFTITSGQPMAKEALERCSPEIQRTIVQSENDVKNGLKVRAGYFRDFRRMKRVRDQELRRKIGVYLKTEMHAQFNALQNVLSEYDLKVSYLNSHHEALIMFEEYALPFMQFARDLELPVRSNNILPAFKRNMYKQVVSALFGNRLKRRDAVEYRRYQKIVQELYSKNLIATPSYMDSRHYGPIPTTENSPLKARTKQQIVETKYYKIRSALNLMEKIFSGQSRRNDHIDEINRTMELLLHVSASDDTEQVNKMSYSGINEKYFFGRHAEYLSILRHDHELPPFAKWADMKPMPS